MTLTKITVLIPARNAAATLAATLDSLVQQSWQDFAVLVVDDASNDRTAEVARGYAPRLPIELLSLTSNGGVAGALNAGLDRIATPYIARLDADDLAVPERLATQFAFLEAHPGIDVCGSVLEMFSDEPGSGTKLSPRHAHDAAIKTGLLQQNTMAHPSILVRRGFFDDVGRYDSRYDYAEDYELWCRGALLGKSYANLQEPLTRYRLHRHQVSQQHRQVQMERDMQVKRKYISALLGGASPGIVAEFLSPMLAFTNRDVAVGVLRQSLPLLFKLGNIVPDQALYQEILDACIARHLGDEAVA